MLKQNHYNAASFLFEFYLIVADIMILFTFLYWIPVEYVKRHQLKIYNRFAKGYEVYVYKQFANGYMYWWPKQHVMGLICKRLTL